MTWEAGAEALPSRLLAGLLIRSNLSLLCKAGGEGEGLRKGFPEAVHGNCRSFREREKGRNPELRLSSGCFPWPPTCPLSVSACQSSLFLSPAPRLGEV